MNVKEQQSTRLPSTTSFSPSGHRKKVWAVRKPVLAGPARPGPDGVAVETGRSCQRQKSVGVDIPRVRTLFALFSSQNHSQIPCTWNRNLCLSYLKPKSDSLAR